MSKVNNSVHPSPTMMKQPSQCHEKKGVIYDFLKKFAAFFDNIFKKLFGDGRVPVDKEEQPVRPLSEERVSITDPSKANVEIDWNKSPNKIEKKIKKAACEGRKRDIETIRKIILNLRKSDMKVYRFYKSKFSQEMSDLRSKLSPKEFEKLEAFEKSNNIKDPSENKELFEFLNQRVEELAGEVMDLEGHIEKLNKLENIERT